MQAPSFLLVGWRVFKCWPWPRSMPPHRKRRALLGPAAAAVCAHGRRRRTNYV